MPEIILDKPYAKLSYVREANYLALVWKADESPAKEYISESDYKNLWLLIQDEFLKRKAQTVLVDQRHIGHIRISLRAWLAMQYMPNVRKSLTGSLAVVLIESKHMGKRVSFKYLAQAAKKILNIDIQKFDSYEDAVAWIIKNR
ncbi:MAG: hypothetical protein JJT94_04755 [Bernardetiaceae bacterium]|nr:hypothetical protein [Bernardetiaceae bacterium]